ncbi:DUF6414 family protein [Marinococcus sp. PL1-022]|uniref:DUF6414 family protein n=1 Tax=Marinococcus sp. PL1-022 TaxID=3095363 RepID=UPI0029C104A7|nr:DUF6414 family protein [Marinococcus sp. PL1-022]MDX6154487.1 DUF6414 family protein [Marinococcus sp. PL1-022]
MQKVICFDEGSATDILQIEYGGELLSIDEENGAVQFGSHAKASAEIGAGTSFFTAIKAAFSTKVGGEASNSKESLVTKTISNTILADFYAISGKLIESNKIHKFESFYLHPIKNSFAFIKMYTPYMKIIKEDSPIMEDMKDYDIRNFDEILESAKGYYELLAYPEDGKSQEVILRFNINTFKNAYSLMDLPKMRLDYYAVEVGKANETDLDIENEMSIEKNTNDLNITDFLEDEEVETENKSDKTLKVYDVILAGIEEHPN